MNYKLGGEFLEYYIQDYVENKENPHRHYMGNCEDKEANPTFVILALMGKINDLEEIIKKHEERINNLELLETRINNLELLEIRINELEKPNSIRFIQES